MRKEEEGGKVRGINRSKATEVPGSLESHGLPVPKQRQQVKNNA